MNDMYEDNLLITLFSGQGELIMQDNEDSSVKNFTIFNTPSTGKNGLPGQITGEDYDGEEFFAFSSLFNGVRNATLLRAKDQDRESAIEWLFAPNQDNGYGLSYGLCCTALSVRENLIRTRIQYELFLKGIITRLPFLCENVPDSFELEAAGIGGDDATDMIAALWKNPGLRADYLRSLFSSIEERLYQRITLDLECNGLIAKKNGCWYFTGRNPLIMRFGSNFNWSKVPVF